MRAELLEMSRTSRVLTQMPSPMEIGAVPKAKRATARAKENPKEKGMASPVVVGGMERVKVVNQTTPTKIRNVDTVRKWGASTQTAENA